MQSREALERWGEQLRGREIPPSILDEAPESPWGYPAEVFRRRGVSAAASASEPTPTTHRAMEALPEGGSVLDVGCGGGATSLPLARTAGLLVGVDAQAEILESFAAAAARAGAPAETIIGPWPDAAAAAPSCDVVVCGHVLYNVQDLAPFAMALSEHASSRVVVELTERHPLHWMNPLWRRFHDVEFPEGPTSDDAAEALAELGFDVHREDRAGRRDRGGFERREDALALVRRRLCLPPERDAELADALGDLLREGSDGLWSAGPSDQTVATLWWDVSSP